MKVNDIVKICKDEYIEIEVNRPSFPPYISVLNVSEIDKNCTYKAIKNLVVESIKTLKRAYKQLDNKKIICNVMYVVAKKD